MILERPTYDTIIGVNDFNYLASIEEMYSSDDDGTLHSIRIGYVGFSDSISLYPDQIEGLRRLLDEVEKYLKEHAPVVESYPQPPTGCPGVGGETADSRIIISGVAE